MTHARGMEYGRQNTGIVESKRKMGNILSAIRIPIGIKTLQLIKQLRRNLVPLLRWTYAGQGKTCCPQEVSTI